MNNPSNNNTSVHVYRRLLGYVKPYWKGFVLAITTMVVIAGTEVGFVALMKPLLDGSFVEKDPEIIKWMPFLLVGIFLLRGVAGFISTYCMTWVGRNVIRDLRMLMFAHILRLPVSYFDTQTSSHLTVRLINHVEQIYSASTTVLTVLVKDSLTVLGLLAWMFYLNWQLAMVFLVIGPIIALVVAVISRRFRVISRNIQNSMGDVLHSAKESVEGQRVVKIFGGHGHEYQTFHKNVEYNRRQHMKMAVANAMNAPLVQLIASFALAAVIYIATSGDMMEEVSVGTFMSLMAAMMLMMPALKRLTNINAQLQAGIAACESVFEVVDASAEADHGELKLERLTQGIEYRKVSFHYPGQAENVLNEISFEAKPGETIAFVGRSGSGKSTLVSLLPRFYSATEGEVVVDGHRLEAYQLESLRDSIALVTQQITLFNDTVANNIAYGSLRAATRQEVEQAAEAANAMEFIRKLPEGLNTMVGENGVLLSGGQRQRIAIARALLKNAPILILDEATSALDTESERLVQRALEQLMSNRTTLVIAHRLSTIEQADKIVVMDDGRIVESGTHQALLAQQGYYAKLHKLQFRDADY
ncbi:MAG: lipid A export permease/ATP-binding protein MsbA [Gammaproteobacteria bacterium]|nr:lipid A export permease/ATP-binding protein MsbA [Gammaproteobacteria bacterium]MCF6231197.1 lipid A export permease/ATP-binding protein MsbA [Gammaproteobacteria bacterium]